MTEQFAFHEVFRNGAAIHGDEFPVLSSALLMYASGGEFLAGSGLAQNQHVRIRRCRLADHFVHTPHGLAFPHKRADPAYTLHLTKQQGILFTKPFRFQKTARRGKQVLGKKRFGHVVRGAELHAFHGRLYIRKCRNHQNRQIRVLLARQCQQLDSADPRHSHVGNKKVPAFLFNPFRGSLALYFRNDVRVDIRQTIGTDFQHALFVVHHQNAPLGHLAIPPRPGRAPAT